MASLHELINIEDVKSKYGLTSFIETGTGMGETITNLIKYNFKLIQSCEIENLQYELNILKFNQDNVLLHLGKSETILPIMLDNSNSPSLIFLDAHFPGQGYVRSEFVEDEYKMSEILPLEVELNILEKWEHIDKSVVVIDDIRIYEKGDYEKGDWPEGRELLNNPSFEFIESFLTTTHDKIKLNKHQGCIIYTPKN